MRKAGYTAAGLLLAMIAWNWGARGDLGTAARIPAAGMADLQAQADDVFALDGGAAPGGRALVLLDRRQRVLAVYHVDAQTGQVGLRCVRNLRWDFCMDDFNGSQPTPREIRALVEPP